ncbi:hypothetical protein [Endozoicomonas atrinae]|uniref:hypothetical protein n=1 Tax=Endozoicomonas atrinae TaxID=1333660 RepID=UPI0008249C78|nr:hypothetical protein [Endozoicomonas atrinae]
MNTDITRDIIEEQLASMGVVATLFDGLEAALVGFVDTGTEQWIAIYDEEACLEVFESQGMTYEDAIEYFEFNVRNCHTGDYTPQFITPVRRS